MISLSVVCLAVLSVSRVLLSESLKPFSMLSGCMLHLSGTRKLRVFTDNENASRIVSVGSPKQHLQC